MVHAGRQAAAAGLAFVVADLAALLTGGPLPSLDDPAASIAAFYEASHGRLAAQGYLRGVAMALLLLFANTLRRVDGAAEPPRGLATLRISLVVVAAVELVRVAVVGAILVAPPTPSATPTWHALGVILGAVIAFPVAIGTIAAVPLLRAVGARWLAAGGVVLAAGWLATGTRALSTSHALWTAGTVVTILWGVWLVALCVRLWRRAPTLA